ncbi:MAG: hypothetical protein ABIC82_02855 [bacterium]
MNRKKELNINLQEDGSNPSDEFIEAFKEAEKDYKSGKIKKFKNINNAIAYFKNKYIC